MWFVKKAKEYGVENLIAFVNSPPVFYTKNGLAFKTTKDFKSNLKGNYYVEYANFLCTVLKHFSNTTTPFNYISPINEPQWDWYNEFGKMHQEGSPWTNEEAFKILTILDSCMTKMNINSKIITPESAELTHMTKFMGHASNQSETFWNSSSQYYIGNLKNIEKAIAGHSYFTDKSESEIVEVRSKVAEQVKKLGIKFWQSEYCLMGDGYLEGNQSKSSFDCAMFLARMIHYDLTLANASAWHYWNSYEPGDAENDTRYYLLALEPNSDFTSGSFKPTDNLYALGHYSRFVTPGMVRVNIESDINNPKLFKSAFYDKKENKLILVVINLSPFNFETSLEATNRNFKIYRTSNDVKFQNVGTTENSKCKILSNSIYTFVSTK